MEMLHDICEFVKQKYAPTLHRARCIKGRRMLRGMGICVYVYSATELPDRLRRQHGATWRMRILLQDRAMLVISS